MLKLYRKTLIACVITAIVTFVIAIACKIIGVFWLTGVFDFIANFMIGICCSSLVVILTTHLQINAEYSRLNSNFSSCIRRLSFRFSLSEIEPDTDEVLPEQYYAHIMSELNKSLDEVSIACAELCFFNKKKDDLLLSVRRAVIKCKINVALEEAATQKDLLDTFILKNKNEIVSLLNDALVLGLAEHDKEEVEKYLAKYGDTKNG